MIVFILSVRCVNISIQSRIHVGFANDSLNPKILESSSPDFKVVLLHVHVKSFEKDLHVSRAKC